MVALVSDSGETVPAKICVDHDNQDGLYYLSISVEGRETVSIGLSRQGFEELLDAGCIVFLEIHPHVHTQVDIHQCCARIENAHLN